MKQIVIILIITIYCTIPLFSQNVNIPDKAFLHALIEEGIDTNGDGLISYTEAHAVNHLDVSEKEISELTGIEAFKYLEELICSQNEFTSLDVSKNYMLMNLECYDNQLTSLDVSNCINLRYLDVSARCSFGSCGEGTITTLDISNNTYLKEVDCAANLLTSLDITNNTKLKFLDCHSNLLTDLDVSNNTALTVLSCGRQELNSLDVSNNTALTGLWCGDNGLNSLDVSNNTALTVLNCGRQELNSLDVSNNTALTDLWCGDNGMNSLDVSNNTMLMRLNCDNNQLTSLDVSNCINLRYLDCHSNLLTDLDVSNNYFRLMNLNCYNNQLTSLDVSNNTALADLSCGGNGLDSLDVSNNTALTNLWLLDMPSLTEVCVWTIPFPPAGVDVYTTNSPNVYFTDCTSSILNTYKENIALTIYPNPFSTSTRIEYNLREPAKISLMVYNHLGQQMETLVNQHQQQGKHQAIWNAESLPAGIYFYRLQAGEQLATGKMEVLR